MVEWRGGERLILALIGIYGNLWEFMGMRRYQCNLILPNVLM